MLLIVGSIGSEIEKARKERAARSEQHQLVTSQTPVLDLFGPAKGSLSVNINTASSKELQTLPGIGYSRADTIIANRPYKSVDDLTNLSGITQRITDGLRPFAKTDGQTEKLKPTK
jgi:competence ComEA-like helix-hairpin-helix protein